MRRSLPWLIGITIAASAAAAAASRAFTQLAERGFSGSTGRRDRKARSLRDLDLQTRLMRVPCSYMIDTAAFDGLPSEARDAIYRRMWTILSGPADGRYRRLSAADRRAVVEILRDTRKDLPTYFQ